MKIQFPGKLFSNKGKIISIFEDFQDFLFYAFWKGKFNRWLMDIQWIMIRSSTFHSRSSWRENLYFSLRENLINRGMVRTEIGWQQWYLILMVFGFEGCGKFLSMVLREDLKVSWILPHLNKREKIAFN
jgi:hypothetical protein